jgi:hypothetical protein
MKYRKYKHCPYLDIDCKCILSSHRSRLLFLGVIASGNSTTPVPSPSNSSGATNPSLCPGTGSRTRLLRSSSSCSTTIERTCPRFFFNTPYPLFDTVSILCGDSGLTGSRPRPKLRDRAGTTTLLILVRRSSKATACAARRSRFRRRIYHPRARKMAMARVQMLTAIPALAASESCPGAVTRARGISVAVGEADVVLDGLGGGVVVTIPLQVEGGD